MALVLLTGATGRLGRALLPSLLARGDTVRAVVRPGTQASLPAGVEKVEFDLSSGALPSSSFDGVRYVVHLAGLVDSHSYNELIAHNANATKELLSQCPSSVKRVVIASSISIYGEYSGQVVDETFTPKTESPYGKSKLMAEDFARDFCDSLPLVFLRFGMIYGPGFEEGYFEVLRYLEKGKMQIIGSGENRIPLLHSSDAVNAILLSLESNAPHCREYNIVGAEQFTQKQLLSLAAGALGVPAPEKHIHPAMLSMALAMQGLSGKKSLDPENIRQLTLDRAYSYERAKKELKYQPKVALAEGVREMVRIYKEKKPLD